MVVLVVLAVAGWIVGRVLSSTGDDNRPRGVGPGGTGGSPIEAAPPVEPDALEGPLQEAGFNCYATMSEPLPIRSCYRTEEDGMPTTVRSMLDSNGTVAEVRLSIGGRPEINPDADTRPAMAEVYPMVAEGLLGDEADLVPGVELEGSEEHVSLTWGQVWMATAVPDSSARFRRDGAATDWPSRGEPTLPIDPAAASDALNDTDLYTCEGTECSSTTDDSVQVDLGEHTVELVAYTDNPQVAIEHAGTLLEQAFGSGEEPMSWVEQSLSGEGRLARADFEPLHIETATLPDAIWVTIRPATAG